MDRPVALKVLPEEFVEDEERRARFGREARLLASLTHPSIAVLYSFEESSGRHLPFFSGSTLSASGGEGGVPRGEAAR